MLQMMRTPIAMISGLIVLTLLTDLADARTGTDRAEPRPNVLLILTDDQGFGDVGFHGNPVIRTPALDRLAEQSVEVRRFYVSPVCTPTRASLMTGRYNYRTRAIDTYIGRALMSPDERTVAELLAGAGYRTGIFGKWHLGDNDPLRPTDRGFDESLVHRGGGIAQPADPPEPGGSSYTDPILQRNNEEVRTQGYCSDVFTDAALEFLEAEDERPFFAYLSFNAPHTPLQVPDSEVEPYREMDLSPAAFPEVGRPIEGQVDPETTARVYGMITNLDRNVGRLLDRLEERGLTEQTIVIFLTDNGPQQPRFNGGLRGLKGSVYEGGIRVPFLIRWPGRLEPGRQVDGPAAHIDILPTLLDACAVDPPVGVQIDGRNLLPQLEGTSHEWPPRTLFFQWHRGDQPERNRAFAAVESRWKLVQPLGSGEGSGPEEPRFELYDLEADPYEQHDLADEHPAEVERLRQAYDAWFDDVTALGFEPVRIVLGSEREPRCVLTRQDWRGPRAGWGPESLGYWEVDVARPGPYRVLVRFPAPGNEGATVRLTLGETERAMEVGPEAVTATFESVEMPTGPGRFEASIQPDGEERPIGVHYAEIEPQVGPDR